MARIDGERAERETRGEAREREKKVAVSGGREWRERAPRSSMYGPVTCPPPNKGA